VEYPTTAQELLKAIRAKPMTQVEVSSRTAIPQSTISKIERGDVGDVRASTYLSLKRLYDELFEPVPPAPKWNGEDRRKQARAG
jgi:transcriptional regulator with XRE-family HTH domain